MTQPSPIWFISDLHLDISRPAVTLQFLQLLKNLEESNTQSLYILGDLFEFWIGDDVLDHSLGKPFIPIVDALRSLTDSGCEIFFIHGNRDFILGELFSERTSIQMLPEHHIIDLYGEPVLIMHGDTLCTDDHQYQTFRAMSRTAQWQEQLLSLGVPERIKQAIAMREESTKTTREQSDEILDVNQSAVEAVMLEYGVKRLIHGHTHRPAVHEFELESGQPMQRIVLGDWYDQQSHLKYDSGGFELLANNVTQTYRF
ncbi:MAG: UDP-2,3-diacylglucosamine diphosphatase (EC [uncultured Thiotrichaceae bacterium]|uniref:UDP-2,3-diacylglucosamine hydrolase n=1 Tax=uncultured Thiotrichaceae bacterium TaxID=298394 RepID=A0A6S6TWI6_9GAMM|nr:MAG: UDP-2,3-diacylglucosamine diphosphatase (EC [uncultured Thiotrichaceae bacterium]